MLLIKPTACVLAIALLMGQSTGQAAAPVSTAFTYQGRLKEGGLPANGYDLGFRLFDKPEGGAQIGSPVLVQGEETSNGLFTVTLDFGAAATRPRLAEEVARLSGVVESQRHTIEVLEQKLNSLQDLMERLSRSVRPADQPEAK